MTIPPESAGHNPWRPTSRTRRRRLWCGIVTALMLTSGCADEPTLQEAFPTQWETCGKLIGADNLNSVVEFLDEYNDELRFAYRTQTVDDMTKSLRREATEPYDDAKGFDEYLPCSIITTSSSFSTDFYWSATSLAEAKDPHGRWVPVGPDLYVADLGDIDLLFRCTIAGSTHQVQPLLEVSVGEIDGTKSTTALQERMAITMARTLRDTVGCANHPNIPTTLPKNARDPS